MIDDGVAAAEHAAGALENAITLNRVTVQVTTVNGHVPSASTSRSSTTCAGVTDTAAAGGDANDTPLLNTNALDQRSPRR